MTGSLGDRLLCRAIEDVSSAVRGLPVLNADRVWDRVRELIGERRRYLEIQA